jgi:hypothetical protein
MYLPLERDVLIAQLNLYAAKANYTLAPKVADIVEKSESNFEGFVKSAFALSMFSDPDKLMAFLDFPIEGVIDADPLYALSMDLIGHYNSSTDEVDAAQEKFDVAFRRLVKGLRESGLSPILYPDANSTLRLSYGTVRALPKDKRNDASKNYFTTLKGTVAKHKPGDKEFDLSQRLIELYNEKDFGRYADAAGHMPVNFLTDNDITGGNSGSPVLNGKGELIGLAFDGNIEAMAGDVIFDDKLQRTINVDIRFVLFIIDKYAGATHLIDELTIVE